MGVEIHNFGCRLNIAEGEAIRLAAEQAPLGNYSRLVVINSCAVTAEAERQARQAVRKVARAQPDARIVVTGCAAEVSAARFAAMPEVFSIVGNKAKLSATAYGGAIALTSTSPYAPVVSGATHARAFVGVQTGCDHQCTFCIIPYGRGASRSARIVDVIAACQAAVVRGQNEVVLTGVDLTSYNDDGQLLGVLVAAILKAVPQLPRLRLSSLDSIEIDPQLEELITSEPRVMPHLHLSLQSGDDMILKRMKRRHARAQAIALVTRLKWKRPEITIGADIIAGFPTETDAMFANSLALIADCDLVFGHIFPYSSRVGTPAARMPQVATAIARVRAAELRSAIAHRKAAWLKLLVGTEQQMLVESDGITGRIENYAPVELTTPLAPKSVACVRIIGADGERLTGISA